MLSQSARTLGGPLLLELSAHQPGRALLLARLRVHAFAATLQPGTRALQDQEGGHSPCEKVGTTPPHTHSSRPHSPEGKSKASSSGCLVLTPDFFFSYYLCSLTELFSCFCLGFLLWKMGLTQYQFRRVFVKIK